MVQRYTSAVCHAKKVARYMIFRENFPLNVLRSTQAQRSAIGIPWRDATRAELSALR